MTDKLPCEVRIHGPGDKVVGAGILVDRAHVITCAHVVDAALGRATGTGGRPGKDHAITLDFPDARQDNRLFGKVAPGGWRPVAPDGRGDVAVRHGEQQPRRVMLHRPVQQELLQILHRRTARRGALPTQITGHQPDMIRPSVRTLPVPSQHRRIQPQLLRQPGHRRRRRRPHLIGHEPQPRQRRQRHGKPEPVSRSPPTARIKEGDICTRQREIPDQIIPADVGERPQPLQLILRKRPRRHRPPPRHRQANGTNRSGNNRHPPAKIRVVAGQRYAMTCYRRSGISDQIFLQDYRDPSRNGRKPYAAWFLREGPEVPLGRAVGPSEVVIGVKLSREDRPAG